MVTPERAGVVCHEVCAARRIQSTEFADGLEARILNPVRCVGSSDGRTVPRPPVSSQVLYRDDAPFRLPEISRSQVTIRRDGHVACLIDAAAARYKL